MSCRVLNSLEISHGLEVRAVGTDDLKNRFASILSLKDIKTSTVDKGYRLELSPPEEEEGMN